MYNNLMRKALLLVGAILVFILMAWTIISTIQSRNAEEKTVRSFISLMHKRDAQTAYNMFSPRLKEQVTLSDFKNALSDEEGVETLTLVRTEEVNADSKAYDTKSTPKIFVFDIDTKSNKYRVKVVVLKSNEEWKIDEYSRSFR